MPEKKGAGGVSQSYNSADGRYTGDTDYFTGEDKSDEKADYFQESSDLSELREFKSGD